MHGAHPSGQRSSTVSFFFRAEDGIRDGTVTGVQTCALPIFTGGSRGPGGAMVKAFAREGARVAFNYASSDADEIGRASCRERVRMSAVAVLCDKKTYAHSNLARRDSCSHSGV